MEFANKYGNSASTQPAEVNQLLRDTIADFGNCLGQVRVLDWGCGKGALLVALEQHGCEVAGTELDEKHVAALQHIFGPDKIKLVAQDNRTDFDDAMFDLITLHHVFEHVQRPAELLGEIARLLKPGGLCLSTFPAWGRIFEPHTKLPFAHYFPKRSVRRRFAVACGVAIGVHAIWVDLPETKAERRALFNTYLDEKTSYTTIAEWVRMAKQAGLEARLVTERTGAMQSFRKRLPWLPDNIFGLICWAVQRFWIVHLQLAPKLSQ